MEKKGKQCVGNRPTLQHVDETQRRTQGNPIEALRTFSRPAGQFRKGKSKIRKRCGLSAMSSISATTPQRIITSDPYKLAVGGIPTRASFLHHDTETTQATCRRTSPCCGLPVVSPDSAHQSSSAERIFELHKNKSIAGTGRCGTQSELQWGGSSTAMWLGMFYADPNDMAASWRFSGRREQRRERATATRFFFSPDEALLKSPS